MEESVKSSAELLDLVSELEKTFGTGKWKPMQLPALTLAFIGDCVYDLVVRTILTTHEGGTNKSLHKKATGIVKAESQAALIDAIEGELTEEETAVFHHGRNAKSSSSAKNASIVAYRKATGLEALIGFLYLEKDYSRIMELMKMGFERTGQLTY